MKRFVHPLLLPLARATQKELVQMVEYLKAENRMLRSRLPKPIEATPAERAKLLKLGVRLGSKLKEVISIVHHLHHSTSSAQKTSSATRHWA
jgi:putative transposase